MGPYVSFRPQLPTRPISNGLIQQFNEQNVDATSTEQHHGMPQFSNPFSRTSTALEFSPSHYRKISPYERSVGVAVLPGRIVTKEERQRRMDSVIGGTIDGQFDYKVDFDKEHNTAAFMAKIAAQPWFQQLQSCMSNKGFWNWRPRNEESDSDLPASLCDFWTPKRRHNLRSLVCFIVLFLILFGTFYVLLEYLLTTTRASACSVTTVYIPVTYTVTAGHSILSAQATHNDTSAMVTHTSTTTRTSTVMETLTSFLITKSNVSSILAPSLTGSPTYAYTTNSAGNTEWINGVSPSSGASIIVVTTTIVMKPLPPNDPQVTAQHSTHTVTALAQTSTLYDLEDTDTTSTSISTHTITYTLSEVSRSSTRTITTTRTSFDGVGPSGWNVSVSDDTTTHDPPSTSTKTSIGYYGAGDDTTSTTTMFITTTIALQYTSTVYPPTGTPYVTTITALPVTISEGSGSSQTTLRPPNTISSASSLTNSLLSNSSAVSAAASTHMTTIVPSAYTHGTISFPSILPNSSSLAVSGATSLSVSEMQSSGSLSSRSVSQNDSSTVLSKSVTSSRSSTFIAGAITATETSLSSALTENRSSQESTTRIVSETRFGGSAISSLNRTRQITSTATGPQTSNALTSEPPSDSRLPTASNMTGINPASTSLSSRSTMSQTISGYSVAVTSSLASSSVSSLPIMNTFSSKITHAKGTPLTGRSSSSRSLSGSETSTTTRTKGSPLSGTNTSKTTRAKGPPLSGVPTRVSHHSGMTTSVRSSAANQSSTDSGISPPSSTITVSPASSVKITVTPPSSLSVIVSSAPSGHPASSQGSMTSKAPTTSSFSNPFPPSSATAIPTAGCGEQGDFLLTFDDLPNFLPTDDNRTSVSQAPPIFSPYHHLTFSDGYVYAPAPSEPYQPLSPPHLAVFLPNATGKVSTQSGDFTKPGEIGDGPREAISAFWFDAHGAFFGCENTGPAICTLTFKAYTWDPAANSEILSFTHNAIIPPCTTMRDLNCQLRQVDFPASFRNLTGLQIQAFTNQGQRMLFMDNLDLRWSNSSCAAGMLRQSSQ